MYIYKRQSVFAVCHRAFKYDEKKNARISLGNPRTWNLTGLKHLTVLKQASPLPANRRYHDLNHIVRGEIFFWPIYQPVLDFLIWRFFFFFFEIFLDFCLGNIFVSNQVLLLRMYCDWPNQPWRHQCLLIIIHLPQLQIRRPHHHYHYVNHNVAVIPMSTMILNGS